MKLIACIAVFFAAPAFAQELTGVVKGPDGAPMEGVLVSAKKDRSTITTTVVSDAQGRYAFPAKKLDAGRYALKIRAVGYALESALTVTITNKGSQADLKLKKAAD